MKFIRFTFFSAACGKLCQGACSCVLQYIYYIPPFVKSCGVFFFYVIIKNKKVRLRCAYVLFMSNLQIF